MSFDYSKSATTALNLLVKFGGEITLSRKTGNSVDPITGIEAAGTDSSVTTTGLLKPYPDNMIDGTRILASDRELVISNEQTPEPSDKPIIDNEEWSIVSIKTIKPFDTVVVFFLQVRR